MEEKKNNTGILLIIVLIIGAVIGFGVSKWSNLFTNDNNKENETVEKEETKDGLELTDEVKAKLKEWIEIADNYNTISGTSTLDTFAKGVTSLDTKTKLIMTYNATDYSENLYTLTKNDISKMETSIDKKSMDGEEVYIMKISDFNSKYKELFQEEATYTIKDLDFGCPLPWGMDKSQDRIYLFDRCGGISSIRTNSEITSYDKDDNYYLVHEKVDIIDTADNNKITKTYKILYKFDKDLKFVSSEKE